MRNGESFVSQSHNRKGFRAGKPGKKWQQNYCVPEWEKSHFIGYSDIWKVIVLKKLQSHIFTYLQEREFNTVWKVLLQDISKELSGPLSPETWGNSSLSDSSSPYSKVIFRITMLQGYFPGRHLGNKLFPATGCGEWHQFIGCIKTWGTDQMIVHQNWKQEEMQFNWHYYCARGFKDSKENCWPV